MRWLCGLLSLAMCSIAGCRSLNFRNTPEQRPTPTVSNAGRFLTAAFKKRVQDPIKHAIEQAGDQVKTEPPSHSRSWRADLMVLPLISIEDSRVRIRNVRDCVYRSEDIYDLRHLDQEFSLDQVHSLDFIVVPFKEMPSLAHTMLSFGLDDGRYFVFSVEARLEEGETYDPVAGALNEYELIWLVGTERDLIQLRTRVRDVDVYLYRTKATPQQVQQVFQAAAERVNQIAGQPEYYHTLTNNCTTNIVDMVNRIKPGYIPDDLRIVLPGHSDRLAYDLGLLAATGPFPAIKQASRINLQAKLYEDSPRFSQAIRGQ